MVGGATSEPKGAMYLPPGAERRKEQLLEPTLQPASASFTSGAFGTDEHSPPQHNVVYEVRAACQTSGIACP